MKHTFIENIQQQLTQSEYGKLNRRTIQAFADELFHFMFNAEGIGHQKRHCLTEKLQCFQVHLHGILFELLQDQTMAEEQTQRFFAALDEIYENGIKDAQFTLQTDPAAKSIEEVKLAYPGFYAIAIYRFAHQLWRQQVPIVPRLWTEFAHSKTGIDIHPGAEIGESFSIDHGTGIVIGETCQIGKYVKIFQGVTLGALYVAKELSETKRHPTVEDHVIIYSNASILGGKTTIGHHAIIGGNVWVTESIAAHAMVLHQQQSITKET